MLTMLRRLRPVTVLVMRADTVSGGSLGFAGIGDVDVEAVTAALGTVNVAARGRAAAWRVRTAAGSRTGCTTSTSED